MSGTPPASSPRPAIDVWAGTSFKVALASVVAPVLAPVAVAFAAVGLVRTTRSRSRGVRHAFAGAVVTTVAWFTALFAAACAWLAFILFVPAVGPVLVYWAVMKIVERVAGWW